MRTESELISLSATKMREATPRVPLPVGWEGQCAVTGRREILCPRAGLPRDRRQSTLVVA